MCVTLGAQQSQAKGSLQCRKCHSHHAPRLPPLLYSGPRGSNREVLLHDTVLHGDATQRTAALVRRRRRSATRTILAIACIA